MDPHIMPHYYPHNDPQSGQLCQIFNLVITLCMKFISNTVPYRKTT